MKKLETPFEDIYNYLNNNLTRYRMREVERSIIDNGESEAVCHTMMFDYQYNRDYIDSLIGTDDEEFEKKMNETCQNLEKTALNKKQEASYKLKENLVMRNLEGLNFPLKMEEVQEAIKKLQPEIDEMLASVHEDYVGYAKEILMKRYGMSEKAATQIVDDLQEGSNTFDKQCEAFKTNNHSMIKENIEALLDGKTEEEKKNLMINSLSALQALKDDKGHIDETIQNAIKKYQEMSVEKLVAEFEHEMTEGDCFDVIVEAVADGRKSVNAEQVEKLREYLRNGDKEYKFYTALVLYMAQCDKKIDLSLDENGVEAKVLGACAAAAITMMQIPTEEADEPAWRRWMKIIFAALYFSAMAFATIVLTASIGVTIVMGLMTLFGQGVIAAIIALGVACIVGKYIADKLIDFSLWSMDALEKPYDWVIDKIVFWIGKIKEKFLIESAKEEQTDKNVADDAVQQPQQGQVKSDERDRGYNDLSEGIMAPV